MPALGRLNRFLFPSLDAGQRHSSNHMTVASLVLPGRPACSLLGMTIRTWLKHSGWTDNVQWLEEEHSLSVYRGCGDRERLAKGRRLQSCDAPEANLKKWGCTVCPTFSTGSRCSARSSWTLLHAPHPSTPRWTGLSPTGSLPLVGLTV